MSKHYKFDLNDLNCRVDQCRREVVRSGTDLSIFGRGSNTIAYQYSIYDNMIKTVMGTRKESVGHCFVATEDVTVPVIRIKNGTTDPYVVVKECSEREVKAGDSIILNNIETAVFLSSSAYLCKASGNPEVTFEVDIQAGVSDTSNGRPIPKFFLYKGKDAITDTQFNTMYAKPFVKKVDDVYEIPLEFEDTFGNYIRFRHPRSYGYGV